MIKWLLFSTILIHIIKNLLLICIRFRMFFGLSNILELIALILSIIFSHDFYSWQMSIRFRCSFQWQCGAVGILIGWITLSKEVFTIKLKLFCKTRRAKSRGNKE